MLNYTVTSNHIHLLVFDEKGRDVIPQCSNMISRQAWWSESIAVGSEFFVEAIKLRLGFRAKGRKLKEANEDFQLREDIETYVTDDRRYEKAWGDLTLMLHRKGMPCRYGQVFELTRGLRCALALAVALMMLSACATIPPASTWIKAQFDCHRFEHEVLG